MHPHFLLLESGHDLFGKELKSVVIHNIREENSIFRNPLLLIFQNLFYTLLGRSYNSKL